MNVLAKLCHSMFGIRNKNECANMEPLTKDKMKEELLLSDKSKIVLLEAEDKLTSTDDHCNVYRVDSSGKTLWQVDRNYSTNPASVFKQIYFDENKRLMGGNFDGVLYEIDIESGRILSKVFLR